MPDTSKIDTSITDPEAVVAVYNTHSEAEDAVKQISCSRGEVQLSITSSGVKTD